MAVTIEKIIGSSEGNPDTGLTARNKINNNFQNVIEAIAAIVQGGGSSIAFSAITDKPTTIFGYGITDAYTETECDNLFGVTKQKIEQVLLGDITSHNHDSQYYKKNELFELKGTGTTLDPYKIEAKFDFYSVGGVSAYGVGSGGSSGGGLIQTVYGLSGLGQTYSNTDLNNTFNAFSINSLYNRIVTLENGGTLSLVNTGTGNSITSLSLVNNILTATKGSTFITSTEVDNKIAALVDSAPTTLDTLNELAGALGDDPNFATTVTNLIATKLPLTGGTLTGSLQIATNIPSPFLLNRTADGSNSIGFTTPVHTNYLGFWNGELRTNTSIDLSVGSKIWHSGNDGTGSGLDADLLDGLNSSSYLSKQCYHFTNGCLVTTTAPASRDEMMVIKIEGNQYNAASEYLGIDTTVQFYNFNSGDRIINAGAINNGGAIEEIRVFNYNDKICFWIKSRGVYEALKIYVSSQNSPYQIVGSVENVAMPTTGVTREVVITPKNSAIRVNRTDWSSPYKAIDNVVGQLAWKFGGNNHTIFDASAGTTPSGTACSKIDSDLLWSATHPTLMGWNGTYTYGVRVDSSKRTDILATSRTLWGQSFNGSSNVSGDLTGVGSLSASGTINANKNTPIGTAHDNLGIVIRSTDGSPVGIGFRRQGYTECILEHTSTGGLAVTHGTIGEGNYSSLTASVLSCATTVKGNFGTIPYSWGGSSDYPTLYGNGTDKWIAHINPHISYVKSGTNGYTDSMTGATTRYASNPAATTYWDAGVGVNSVGEDIFSIGRAGVSRISIDNAGNIIVNGNISCTGAITAYGIGSGGSPGGGLIQTVYGTSGFGGTYNDATLTDTFNAYSINSLYNRIISLEAGSALNFAITGTGNAITSISKTGTTVTAVKGSTFSLDGHTHTFASLTSKPTTLSGYGITDSLILGSTSSTAYRGDLGTIAYNHSQVVGGVHVTPTERNSWNTAYTKSHEHANKSLLDAFTQSDNDVLNLFSVINGNLVSSANIVATGAITAYTVSDKRLKENIKPINNALDFLHKVNTYEFDFNAKALELNPASYKNGAGVISQELLDINKDFVHSIYTDYLGVDYERFIPYLISGVNEVNDEVTTLKNRVSELEKELTLLKYNN